MVTSPSEQHKTLKKKPEKTRKNPKTFFNPETETDPDRKPTFAQKPNPIPTEVKKSRPQGSNYNITFK
jgi:hypothetical protein